MRHLHRIICLMIVVGLPHTAHTASALCSQPSSTTAEAPTEPAASNIQLYQSMQAAKLSAASLDWISDDEANNACQGYYVDPDNPHAEKHLPSDKATVRMSADQLHMDDEGYMVLAGDVAMYHGARRISADQVRYSQEQQHSQIAGNVQLREPGMLITADNADIYQQTDATPNSHFSNAEFILHEQQLRLRTDSLTVINDEQQRYQLNNTGFTFCPPNDEAWRFNTKTLNLNIDEGWGQAYSSVFYIKELPVFYLPYIDFPIDDRRKTGFLWPSIARADQSGLDITLPYYINLAPNYDVSYIPRYNHDHGFLHGLETRYKNRVSEWSVGGTYIDADDQVGDVRVKDNPQLDNQRWLGFIKESGRFNDYWSSAIDYTAVSDINYFRDWGTSGLDIQRSLNIKRSANINYYRDAWSIRTQFIDYQRLEFISGTTTIVEEDYRSLPRIDMSYTSQQHNFRLNPIYSGQYVFFDHETRIRAQRFYAEPGLHLPMRWSAIDIDAYWKIKYNAYDYNDSNDSGEVTVAGTDFIGTDSNTIPTFTLDIKTYFERSITYNNQSYFQTLTPRLFYYHADFEQQSQVPRFDTSLNTFSLNQVFRESRFSSVDRIDDANQLGIGLSTDILNGNTGQTLFDFSLGQIHYFDQRRIALNADSRDLQVIELNTDSAADIQRKQQLNHDIDKRYFRNASDIAMQAHWHMTDTQQLSANYIYDPYAKHSVRGGIGYEYRPNNGSLFNAHYQYINTIDTVINDRLVDSDTEQTDISTYFPISAQWDAFLRWNYDLTNHETIEDLSGFKYENCCWSVMFAYQRERKTFENNSRIDDTAATDYRYGWHIQFELKGLGGISNSITQLLEESIRGYKQRKNDE